MCIGQLMTRVRDTSISNTITLRQLQWNLFLLFLILVPIPMYF